ncbi:MAG: FAD-dependent oxidoreductase [Akkermansiaceae bacterium]|nr:FAD-dependent oxidoreductase [Akkermansiaceae bacterium]
MHLKRRHFLKSTAAASLPLFSWAPWLAAQQKETASEWHADVVIIGGGMGGCAAALAACEAGLRVIMTEPTDWIGGQLTSQCVPPDEHRWIEEFGCTRSYRDFRNGVRQYYRDHYPLTDAAKADPKLNPGGGGVSRICHEPRVALAVLEQMLAPWLGGRHLRVLLEHEPVSAAMDGDRVKAVTVRDVQRNREVVLSAPYFIDASELGDLLPLTGTEHVIGAEARADTGEPRAPEKADPNDQQAVTWCFAMDHIPGEDHVTDKPANYDFWRDYVPALTPPWPGKLLSWTMSHPATLERREMGFDPMGPGQKGVFNLFNYRRLANPAMFKPGTYRGPITLVNWPQNDYLPGPIIGGSKEDDARHLAGSRELSLALFHWMQTEAPRPDGGTGWPGLRLRGDITGTTDGLAKAVYVREARRILAEFTVTENHVGTEARMAATGLAEKEVKAADFPDTVGIGSYRIDLHPSTSGRNYVDFAALPFQIPLGALIPRRVENLIAANKNIGSTHLTNGCYRLHPVEWNIGEAAGALVAEALAAKVPPRQVRNDRKRLAEYQDRLTSRGVELRWPESVVPS